MEKNKKVHNDGKTQPREKKIEKSDKQPALDAAEAKLKMMPQDPR
jgi:hypothetical protein